MESIWVKRTFVALVAAACALLVACAFAQPARAATKRVEVPFETDMTIEWDTSMSYFKGSSTTGTADNRLAIAGLVLSNAAESSQENVKTALNALGFGSVQSEGYSTNDIYNPAVSFAISKSTVGGKYVVACVVRGTSNFNDIMTDVIATQDGFAVAGSNTFDKLKIYIKGKNASRKKAQQLKSSNTTLWLTGHSLGAATVSVMAQDTGSLAPKNRTFVYAFACPNYATRFASADSYKNIHYYRNYDDAVPNVPVGIGFGKLGVEHVWKYEGVSWEPVLSAKQKLRYDKACLLLRGKAFKDDDITWHDHLPCTYMAYLLCGMKESEIEECFGGRPAAPKLKKLTSKNAKVKAEWSKAKGADGYVIYAAKSGGDFEQVKELAGAGKTSAKISGLTAGKKYKLYVRAYREVSGQKIYSAGSAEKTIKVAKSSLPKPSVSDIANGSCGSCSWIIDKNGKLSIYPTNGKSGTLVAGDEDEDELWPWEDYSYEVVSIVVYKGVSAGDDMTGMFFDFSELTTANLSKLDVSKVESMSDLFGECTSLTTLKLGTWNTAKVTDMSYMFSGCSSLKLDASGWKVTSVEEHEGFNEDASGVTPPNWVA